MIKDEPWENENWWMITYFRSYFIFHLISSVERENKMFENIEWRQKKWRWEFFFLTIFIFEEENDLIIFHQRRKLDFVEIYYLKKQIFFPSNMLINALSPFIIMQMKQKWRWAEKII